MKRYVVLFLVALSLLIPCITLSGCKGDDVGLTEYYVDAAYDGDKTVVATMTVEYFNNTDNLIEELWFNLYPNAFREGAAFKPYLASSEAKAFPNGKSYGQITVTECREGDDGAQFSIGGKDENILVLCLKKGVYPGERACVEIDFTLTLASCNLRLGVTKDTVNLGNWYPVLCAYDSNGFYECTYSAIGDPFYSDVADYTVRLTVPGEYTVASGGDCTLTEVGDKFTSYTYEIENARDVAFVLSKQFNVMCEQEGDVTVSFYYVRCDYAADVLDAACDAITTFTELFGEYPYPSFTVAQTPFVQGGMEYPSLVYVSDALDRQDFITATVHEAAHQWWYAVVGCNQVEHAFLDEGLAEYSTLLFYEINPSYNVDADETLKAKNSEYRAFYGVYEQLMGSVNTVMDRSLNEFSSEYEYVEICYVKPVLMLSGFRKSVGDRRFFKGLKHFYKTYAYKNATPDCLISSFCHAGCDAEGYFNSWIDGKVLI